MMQDSLRNTLDVYADIIEDVEDLEITQKNVVSRLKVKLRLFDGLCCGFEKFGSKGKWLPTVITG